MKKVLFLLLLFFMFIDIVTYAIKPIHGVVRIKNQKDYKLNVYSAPGKNVIAKLNQGDRVFIYDVKGNWYKIEADLPLAEVVSGYAHAGYIKVDVWEDTNDDGTTRKLFDNEWKGKPKSNFASDLSKYQEDEINENDYTVEKLNYEIVLHAWKEAKAGRIKEFQAIERAISNYRFEDKKNGGMTSLRDVMGISIFDSKLSVLHLSIVLEKSIVVKETDVAAGNTLENFAGVIRDILVFKLL